MKPTTKVRLLGVTAFACGLAALGLAVLAFVLIRGGAYPPDGTGSLGHVGMVIAGAIAAFLGLLFGGLALVCASRIRAIGKALRPDPGRGATG